MTINNRGLSGQPALPYPDFRAYAGEDVFAIVAFLDHMNVPVFPNTICYQIDDLTNSKNMVPRTCLTPPTISGNPLPFSFTNTTVQLPASYWDMTYPWQGSQVCQISWDFTALDSVTQTLFTGRAVNVVELCAIQTPNAMT